MINFNDIKILIVDVDGTLTDGIYQISNRGNITKSFHTRDFDALDRMIRMGIFVFIVTQSHDEVIEEQVNRISWHSQAWEDSLSSGQLKILTCVENKRDAVNSLISTTNEWTWHNIAYIGDAENDIKCMKKALFTGCPSDAIDSVKISSNYISDFPGGKGAVYQFCMYILSKMENK